MFHGRERQLGDGARRFDGWARAPSIAYVSFSDGSRSLRLRLRMVVRLARIAASGAELFVRQVGGGDGEASVLVTVHGGPGLSHEPLEALEVLASANLAVVSDDQRGVGQSSGAVDRERVFDQSLEDLEHVRRFSGADRVHLLGHSWGGLLAALYASRQAPRVRSLLLVDSIPATSAELDQAMRRQEERLRDFQERGLVPAELPSWEDDGAARLLAIWPIYFVDPCHPGARTLGGARLSPRVAADAGSALDRYDVSGELGNVVAPTLHFIAPVPFGCAMGEGMARALPNAPGRRVLQSCAGHLPFVEEPQAFVGEIKRFLAELEEHRKAGAMDKSAAFEPRSEHGPLRRPQG
jgi:proline iminopeptidase